MLRRNLLPWLSGAGSVESGFTTVSSYYSIALDLRCAKNLSRLTFSQGREKGETPTWRTKHGQQAGTLTA